MPIDWSKATPVPPATGRIDWSAAKPVEEPPKSGLIRRAIGDTGVSLLKGAVSVPEAAVGLADLPTGGRIGKAAEELGFRPREAKEALSRLYSPEYQEAAQEVSSGFKEGVIPGAKALATHPSVIAQSAAESLPLMGAGGVVARGVRAVTAASPVIAGAVGEGTAGAGIAAESIRQQTETGTLTPEQSALATASGIGTALFGAAGGKIAQKLGIADPDTFLASGLPLTAKRGFVRRVLEGFAAEGAFEELPQSVQERAAENVALGRPIEDGLLESGVMGFAVGGVMGAGFNALAGSAPEQAAPPEIEAAAAAGGAVSKAAKAGYESGAVQQATQEALYRAQALKEKPGGEKSRQPFVNPLTGEEERPAEGRPSAQPFTSPVTGEAEGVSTELTPDAATRRGMDVAGLPAEDIAVEDIQTAPGLETAPVTIEDFVRRMVAQGKPEEVIVEDIKALPLPEVSDATLEQYVAAVMRGQPVERVEIAAPQDNFENPAAERIEVDQIPETEIPSVRPATEQPPSIPGMRVSEASPEEFARAAERSLPVERVEIPPVQAQPTTEAPNAPLQAKTETKTRYADPRLVDETYRTYLKGIRDSAVKRGGVGYVRNERGDIVDRTPSLNSPVVQGMIADRTIGSVKELQNLINKALLGVKPLTEKQATTIRQLLDGLDIENQEASQQTEDAEIDRRYREWEQSREVYEVTPTLMSAEVYTLDQLFQQAREIDEDRAVAAMERGTDAEVVRSLLAIIEEGNAQNDTVQSVQQDQPESRGPGPAPLPAGEGRETRAAGQEVLQPYSEQDLATREAERQAADTERQEAERRAAEKEQADRERETFALTGSDREADQAAAQGQQDLLSQTTTIQTPHNAPRDLASYIDADQYEKDLRATYFKDGKERLSSRDAPQTAPIPPVGSWRIEKSKTMDGRGIEQLVELDVDNIEVSEDTGPQKWPDVKRYAQWIMEGMEPPPISVLQTDAGTLKTLDHRRLMAAKAAGQKKIKAWVSWLANSERNTPTGLTYELAKSGVQKIPVKPARQDRLLFPDDAKALERIRSELTPPAQPATPAEQPAGAQTETETEQPAPRKAQERPAPTEKIEDVGEKIGGARKDTSSPTGPRVVRPKSDIPGWRKRYSVSQIVKSSKPGEVGRWSIADTRKKDWLGQDRQIGPTYATKEEAEAAVPVVEVARNHSPAYRKGKDGAEYYQIVRNVTDRKRVTVVPDQFQTREAALEYMAAHAVEIIETKTSFGEEILPRPDTVRRTGAERRQGNIKGEDFKDTFGFRGVEFGNWEAQDERQTVMNHAYDALMDLAEILNIPPKAIGLNGELGLAFGARGHGLTGARAHYERSYGVINLTKMKGAGSLAHEWFHSLDHYFGRQDTKAKSEREANERGDMVFPAVSPAADYVSHGFKREGSGVRPELREAYNALIQTMFKKAETYVEDSQNVEEFTGRAKADLEKELNDLRSNLAMDLTQHPQYGKYYVGKRNTKPASAEQLAAFDEIATKMLDGEMLETEWRTINSGQKRRSIFSGSRWTNDALEKLSEIHKAVRGRSGFDSTNRSGVLDSLRNSMERYSQRLRLLASAQQGEEKVKHVPTEFAMAAKELDQGRGENYWITEHEMAARAFQSYVEDKVGEHGNRSDFLTYGTNMAVPTPWGWVRPFPKGEERVAINKAFDKFVSALQTKETEKGVALFSRSTEARPQSGLSVSAARTALAKEFGPSFLERNPWFKVVQSVSDLPQGAQAPGTRGVTTHEGNVYLVADHVTADGARDTGLLGVALHEGAHANMASMLGRENWQRVQNWLEAHTRSAQRGTDNAFTRAIREARAAIPNDTPERHVAEETLAYMIQQRANHGIPMIRKVLGWLRAWAFRLGLSPKVLNTDALVSLARMAIHARTRGVDTVTLEAVFASRSSFPYGEPSDAFRLAIDKMLSERDGNADALLLNSEIGAVDVVYGQRGSPQRGFSDGYGLAHILVKHPEINPYALEGIVASARKVREKGNTVELETPDHRAIVKLDWQGEKRKWLLTAFEIGPAQTPGRIGGGGPEVSGPSPEQSAERTQNIGDERQERNPTRSTGLPADAKHIHTFTTDKELKAHPDYKAAKAGDLPAAARLVANLVSRESLRVAKPFGDAIFLPVRSVESSGDNAIPWALARRYAGTGEVDTEIVQANKAYHTGADPMERLLARTMFDGPVQAGRDYVLVDDVTTMGGTLSDLAAYVQRGGGRVVGTITLTNASRATTFTPSPGQIRTLEGRLGNEIRELFHIEPAALTADEARYLVGFRNADELRGRAAKAESERGRRLLSKGVQPVTPETPADAGVSAFEVGEDTVEINLSLTDTPAFKNWFGKSKMVDKDGEPRTFYHYTDAEFEAFDPDKVGSATQHAASGLGFFFSPTKLKTYGNNKIKAWLKIENPYRMGLEELQGLHTVEAAKARAAELRADGYDGVVMKSVGAEYVVAFKPTQVKSTDNFGDFDPDDPRFRYSRAGEAGRFGVKQENEVGWIATQDAATQEALRKAGVWRPKESLLQRSKNWMADWQKRAKQGIVDQFDPIKEYDYRAYMLARLTRGSDAALEAVLNYGTVKLDKDGAVDVDFEGKGFFNVLSALNGEHERFMAWVMGNRAARLMEEGREHNFTAEDIARLKALNHGKMKDGSSRAAAFLKAKTELDRYNKSIMDLAEQAGIIDGESRQFWEKENYIPFYRLMEDDSFKGPVRTSGLVRQYAFKTLKGGAQAIGDPLHNMLSNWSHLLDASLKNQAAVASLEAAEKLGAAHKTTAEEKDSVFILKNGQKQYYGIDDPFLLDAVKAIGFTGFQGPAMKAMQNFKRWLTVGVTVNPTFRIRNLIRDSLSMIGANPASYNVLSNVVTGWRGTREGSPEYASIIAGGGVMRFGTVLEGDRARHAKRLIEAGIKDKTVLNTPAKVKDALQQAWDWWQKVGDRAENVNRVALYKKLRAEGKSHLEASYAARDVMDFSMGGTWAAVRFLTQTVPFMNARLQGLYKLGRGAKEDPQRFAAVLGATALASMALLLAYKDDDDWKQREDWDRETYWWFKIGDQAYRIPKPFEIGTLATMAERGLEMLVSDEFNGEDFGQRVWQMLMQQLSLNPMPQMIMPAIEVWANKDSFTGRPIETMGMERLSKSERIGPRTSAVAQVLGKAGVLSPVQIDHVINGYLAWLGVSAIALSDFAVRPAIGAPQRPALRVNDVFVVGDFVKELPEYQSKYVTKFYEDARKSQEAMADVRHYEKLGMLEKAMEIRKDKGKEVANYKLYARAQRQLSEINSDIKKAQMSKGDAEMKRQRLDRLYEMRNRLAELTARRARATVAQ